MVLLCDAIITTFARKGSATYFVGAEGAHHYLMSRFSRYSTSVQGVTSAEVLRSSPTNLEMPAITSQL
jgi:hypothetical protein